jgi:hypothetical protein
MSYYRSVGQEDAAPDLVERRETRDDARLELERQSVTLDVRRVKAQEKAAFWEALQALALVGIPIAGFFGLRKFITGEKGKSDA